MRYPSPLLLALVWCASCSPNEAHNPVLTAAPSASTSPPVEEPVPELRLPVGVKPTAETVELTVDPRAARFSGRVEIDLELSAPRRIIWLNGRGLHVTKATLTPDGQPAIEAGYAERDPSGIAAVSLPTVVAAGKARLELVFDAPFAVGQKGLYTVTQAKEAYAFTQFEATAARTAFPCFDEPAFKIPFALTLVVPKGMEAVANTQEVSRSAQGEQVRVTFSPTEKLPSYLVALAVGPLDVVKAPDIPSNEVRKRTVPLRAVTAKGRGKEAAYALTHTGEILAKLEAYTRVAYPYDKLDIIAIPGKGGAMENAGAVTFGEFLMLLDPATAPIHQRRAYAQVMAHELAHMWVGDLVTMAWWDDLWLNEAFATWLGSKIADAWDPTVRAEISLLQGIQGAMGTDGLVSARAIRQPIKSNDDIENAFDGITYRKGGGTLAMFERWVGSDAWQKGFTKYLEKHRHGNASTDDFLDAMNEASGKDVKGAFHTFLDQVGVPFVEASLKCAGSKQGPATIHFKQSRYLPIGSSGDAAKTWKIPVCVRYGRGKELGESCTLLTERESDFTLPTSAGCPTWIFPNAEAAGYYRVSLATSDLAALRKEGLAQLSMREKVAYANSVRAAYSRAVTPFGDAIEALAPLVNESDPALAGEPMGLIGQAREFLYDDPLRKRVDAYGQKLYGPIAKRLGWQSQKGESDEVGVLRTMVLGFLAENVEDPATRKEAMQRGLAYIGAGKDGKLHPETLSSDLAGTALGVVGDEADRATWETLLRMFKATEEAVQRSRLLWAMASVKAPELRTRALELTLDPSLRDDEITAPLWGQLRQKEAVDGTWAWIKAHEAALFARLPKHHGGVQLIAMVNNFCDDAHGAEAEAFFKPKLSTIEGGPRELALALESVRLCVAKRKAQEPHMRSFFQKR